ncbi:MAG: T9SS type A sorting domain-containing protein [Bacteroidetes bacterium]|nr:T9SS type A sorting domain-containing protein [Bacteroidota bacterium]
MKQTSTFKSFLLMALFLLGFQRSQAAISSGTYTIGATGTYPTLAAAIADIGSLSGSIVLNIQPGSYSGSDWQVQIPNFAGSSSSNRVTIQAANGAGTVTISNAGTSSANYVLQLNGSQYVSIKNLTIVNTGTTYGRVLDLTGGASYDSVLGCTLTGVSGSSSSNNRAVISATSGGSMNSNVIKGNTIQYGSYGVYWNASSTSTLASDDVISNNTFSGNYYAYIYTQYMGNATIQFNTCSASSISGYHYGIYMYYPQNGFTITNNTITTSNTSGYLYGIYSTYGNSSTTSANDLVASNNTITLNSTSYVYGIDFYYYNYNIKAENNNITTTATNGYTYGVYVYWFNVNIKFNNNVVSCSNTSSGYIYAVYFYYNNYGASDAYLEVTNNTISYSSNYYCYDYFYFNNYNGTNCTFKCNNNTFNCTELSTSAYNYGPYFYYTGMYGSGNSAQIKGNVMNYSSKYYHYISYMLYQYHAVISDNVVNATCPSGTSGYGYIYGPADYYCEGAMVKNNTLNYTHNGSGGCYNYTPFVANSGSGGQDTAINNTFNINLTSGSYYNYAQYANGFSGNNTINVTTTSGSIYNYPQYNYGGLLYHNKLNFTTNSGTIYGYYAYGYPSYPGATWVGNTIDMTSNTGTIYGCGGYLPGNEKLIGNVFKAKTNGSTYMYYEPSYGNYADMYYLNNTFHSASTGSTNYLIYKQAGSGSYNGVAYLYNNIFSRNDGTSTSPAIYLNDTTYWRADYNLYYTPGTVTLRGTSKPNITTTSLQAWRNATNRDRNSLIFDPGYKDAVNKDVHPDPSNPNSWAVNGRGMHIDGDTLDADGVMRPKTRQDGVPDLGAYEVSPVSTPPACTAIPAAPAAGTTQYFLFGQDTAASIAWGPAVPSTAVMRQYSGQQAGAPMPSLVGRSYLWLDLFTNGVYALSHTPTVYYKDPQLGTISTEANAKIANSSNGSPWMGYNYGNAATDPVLNKAYPTAALDSVGKYTIVENARIGIRCVINPEHVKVSNITAFTADVDWDAVFLPIGYQVIVDTKPGTPASGAGALFATTNTISLTALTENTHYYVHVRSICGVKDTSGWTTVDFTTLITCHTPEPKLITLTQSRAILYWDTIQTATKYEYVIQHAPTPVPAFGTVINTPSLQLPLAPASDYYVFVKAYCNSIYPESEWGVLGFSTFPTAINTISGNSIGLSAYPNPVTDVLHVELSGKIDGEATLTVTDVTGKQVRSIVVNANQVEVNMNGLPAGVYQLKYSDRSHVDVMKVSKQ